MTSVEERVAVLEQGQKIANQNMGDVKKIIENIRDNHLDHMQTGLTKVSNDVDWLKRFFWVIATASTGSLIAAIFNLIDK